MLLCWIFRTCVTYFDVYLHVFQCFLMNVDLRVLMKMDESCLVSGDAGK